MYADKKNARNGRYLNLGEVYYSFKFTILQNESKFPNKKFGLGPGIPIFSNISIFSFLCL